MKSHQRKIIDQGFLKARSITKKHAKTFYFASHFLPLKIKNASYSVYAICRLSDDAVDSGQRPLFKDQLQRIATEIESAYNNTAIDNSLAWAFKQTVEAYKIPKGYFDELLEGMRMDLEKTRYHNFDELYHYCYRVAGVVGLIMLKIFGTSSNQAEKYAVDLGIAMQLTNILRDIKEDYFRGRIYLPQDEMSRFGVLEDTIASKQVDEKVINLLKFQIKRAKDYYQNSSKGIDMISNGKSRLVVRLMKNMYAGILQSIENNEYDVFSQRAHVTFWGKIAITVKTLFENDAY